MERSNKPGKQRYRIVPAEGSAAATLTLEFETHSALAAMLLAQRAIADRQAQLFENDRLLGIVRYSDEELWSVLPIAA